MAQDTITTNTKAIAAALRARVLRLTPEEIGFSRDSAERQAPAVYGAVIETAHPDAIASLVVLADGSVSFYVSDGNGCVGCGAHREVRQASAELLLAANRALPLTTFTNDVSLPPSDHVRFYLLTPDGLRAVQSRLEEINAVDERLGVLYFSGQRVLAAVERVGAGQSLAQEIRLALNAIESDTLGVKDQPQPPRGVEQCLSVGNVVRRLRT